jgi:PAS domain S-box-containing protein
LENDCPDLHDAASSGCFSLDKNGLILDVNLAGSVMLFTDKTRLLNMPFVLFVQDEDRLLFRRYFRKVFDSQHRQTCILGLTSRGGEQFHAQLESGIEKSTDGGPDCCRMIVYDLSREKALAEKSRESGERLLSITDRLPMGVLYLDVEERFCFSNRILEQWLNKASDEIGGRKLTEVLGGEVYRSIEKHLRASLAGSEVTFERVLFRDDNGPRLMTVSLTPDFGADGRVRGIVALISDVSELKHAEEAQRRSEGRLRRLLENVQEGIWVLDTRAVTTFCNPRMAEMLGYSVEEMTGRSLESCLDESEKRVAESLMSEALRDLRSHHDVELRGKDGKRIYTSVTVSSVTDSEGIFDGMLVCVSDISERVRAEAVLRLSESRFRQIYDDAPVMMHSINEEGIILNANKKWLESLGYRREEVIGHTLEFIMTKESSRRAFHEILPSYWQIGKVTDVPYQYRRKDGTVMDVLLDSIVMEDTLWGKISLSVVRDVTDANRAEAARRESEERFQALFEGARDCIYIKDGSLAYTHVNPAMGKLFGLAPSAIVGMRADDLYGEAAGKRIREVDLRVLEGESIEEEHTRPVNGIEMTFHDIKVPLRNTAGEVVGLCGFGRNITERRRVVTPTPALTAEYPSEAMKNALAKGRQAAAKDSIVLLLGESGSGKDFLARWIHDLSRRAKGPFFSVNCAAIPHDLAESEFFGHERGAFTGALGRKRGLLELAEGGTLLLNEIGELPLALQSKLMTFLDTRSFLRVGGEKNIHVNARLIAATHRDLKTEVARGRFFQALYYRLNVFAIEVPPLRERVRDIPLLVREIMARLAVEMQLIETPVPDQASIEALCRYHWPGNVRELRNVLERSLMLSGERRLKVSLPSTVSGKRDWCPKLEFPEEGTLHDVVDRVIEALCVEALRRSAGNRKQAAKLLGISRDSLYRFLKRVEEVDDN